jgi:hypothetical protein
MCEGKFRGRAHVVVQSVGPTLNYTLAGGAPAVYSYCWWHHGWSPPTRRPASGPHRCYCWCTKNVVRQGYFYHWNTMIWCVSSKLVAIKLVLLVTTSKNLCCIRLQNNDDWYQWGDYGEVHLDHTGNQFSIYEFSGLFDHEGRVWNFEAYDLAKRMELVTTCAWGFQTLKLYTRVNIVMNQ